MLAWCALMVGRPTYPASVVCRVASGNGSVLGLRSLEAWRLRGLLAADKAPRNADTSYTFCELVRACALAELSRQGLTFLHDYKQRSAPLLAMIEQDLCVQLEAAAATQEPQSPHGTARYILADQALAGAGNRSQTEYVSRTIDELLSRLGELAGDDNDGASVIVMDAAKLFRRIVRKLRELGQEVPGGGLRAPNRTAV